MDAGMNEGPLKGIKIIDASSVYVKLCLAGLFLTVVIILLILTQKALYSQWGRKMRAIRDNEEAAWANAAPARGGPGLGRRWPRGHRDGRVEQRHHDHDERRRRDLGEGRRHGRGKQRQHDLGERQHHGGGERRHHGPGERQHCGVAPCLCAARVRPTQRFVGSTRRPKRLRAGSTHWPARARVGGARDSRR